VLLPLGQWVTRASGELGLIAFLEGNPRRAARLLGGALLQTMANGDTAGQVRILELLGRGFEEVNRHAEAAIQFEKLGNQFANHYDVDILCGYFLGCSQAAIESHIVQQICAEHSAVRSL